MNLALNEARLAFSNQEVPVGAVLVKENKIISQSIKTNFKDLKNKKELSGLAEELFAEKLHLKTDTATDIRELLKEWNPFI